SYDGGDTWAPPVTVAAVSNAQGSFPAISNQGVIYVAHNIGYPAANQMTAVARSVDGGETFQRVATFPVRTGTVPGLDRTPAFPQIAVDMSGGPRDGWAYVVWNALGPDNVHRPYMSHTEDGGATWIDPVVVNTPGADNAGHRWYPTVSVDDNGTV